jgi:hypothetical protein
VQKIKKNDEWGDVNGYWYLLVCRVPKIPKSSLHVWWEEVSIEILVQPVLSADGVPHLVRLLASAINSGNFFFMAEFASTVLFAIALFP